MSIRIQGMGWVTAIGRDLDRVWEAVRTGSSPASTSLTNPFAEHSFPVYQVDPASVSDVARLPRLRRSSVISHFAVAAALDAVKAAGTEIPGERLAIIFTATNGGVIYTRRFYEEVSRSGTQAGSPLLFPETVYNAPASHIAASLGVTGVVTTIVNDASAGVDAVAAASELLDTGEYDHCLVVAAEEADWAICEAYAAWKLIAAHAPIEPFSGRGAVFSEGAAAILLGRDGSGPIVDRIDRGTTFTSVEDACAQMAAIAQGQDLQATISGASGTAFDEAEKDVSNRAFSPKVSLGEAFAASTVMQIICAALSLRDRPEGERVFVPTVGFHGQLAALTLRA